MADDKQSPTDVKLDTIIKKLESIEGLLFGDGSDDKPGMRLDVDRLKRSRAAHNAVLWVIFLTLASVAGTVIASMVGG